MKIILTLILTGLLNSAIASATPELNIQINMPEEIEITSAQIHYISTVTPGWFNKSCSEWAVDAGNPDSGYYDYKQFDSPVAIIETSPTQVSLKDGLSEAGGDCKYKPTALVLEVASTTDEYYEPNILTIELKRGTSINDSLIAQLSVSFLDHNDRDRQLEITPINKSGISIDEAPYRAFLSFRAKIKMTVYGLDPNIFPK